MKKLKRLFAAGLLLLMMVSLAACAGSQISQSTGGQKESSSKSGEGTVNIGFSGPLSGPAALYGERTLNGIKMAAEEINNNGGFEINGKTYKLNIVPLDDKYLPNETASNAKRLLQEYKTPIIFTPHSGGVMALQVFNETEKFLIGAYTSEPDVTDAGNSLTIGIPPRYDGYVEPFTDYAMKRFGKKLAALPPSTQYGKDWAKTLLPQWEKKGGKVVYHSSIDFSKETDFFTIVTNALKEKPDVLFIGGASEPTAKVAKQARELGFKGGFIIMDQAKLDFMEKITGSYDVLEGSVGVLPLVKSNDPGAPAFVENYRAKFKDEPSSESGLNYIATYIFVEAMKAAKTVDDAEAIRKHMQDGLDNLPKDKRVYEIPSIGDDGRLEVKRKIAVVEDGQIVLKVVD